MASLTTVTNKILLGVLWIAILALTTNLAWSYVRKNDVARAASIPVDYAASEPLEPPTPFLVVLQETAFSRGNSALGVRRTHAVRADGSWMRQDEYFRTPQFSTREILMIDGTRITTDDRKFIKSTTFDKRNNVFSGLRSPKSSCLNSLLGAPFIRAEQRMIQREQIAGYDAVHILTRGRFDQWFVPAIGCVEIQSIAVTGAGQRSEQRVVALLPGEPPSDLFSVDERYREVPMSALNGLDPASAAGKAQDAYYGVYRVK